MTEIPRPRVVRVIGRNIFSNWTGLAINGLVTILLTPIVIGALGETRYGLWILANSVVGYQGLFDLGFRSGVSQHVTRYLAAGDLVKANRALSSALVGLSAAGAAFFAFCIGAGTVAPAMLDDVSGDRAGEVLWVLLWFGAMGATRFVTFPYTAVLIARQRFDLINLTEIAPRLGAAAGIYWAVTTGRGLIAIAAISALFDAAGALARIPIAHSLVDGLTLSVRAASWAGGREILSFGLWVFLISLGGSLSAYSAPWVIGIAFSDNPAAAIGFYSLAAAISAQLFMVVNQAGSVFYPAATGHHARQETVALRGLYLYGSRLTAGLAALGAALAWVWIPDFYRLWLGGVAGQLQSAGSLDDLALLARLLLGTWLAFFATGISNQVLMAMRNLRGLAACTLIEALLFISLGFVLLRGYGLPGLAAASIVSVLACRTYTLPRLLQSPLECSPWQYSTQVWPRAIAIAAATLVLARLVAALGRPDTLAALALWGAVSGIISLPVAIAIGTTGQERREHLPARVRRWV